MKRLVFQSFPNNEIRVGLDDLPYPKERGGDLSAEKKSQSRARELEVCNERWLSDNRVFQYRDAQGTLWRGRYDEYGDYDIERYKPELVITSEIQQASETDSKLRRDISRAVLPTRFTRQARHRILEGAAIIERRCLGHRRGVFVTATLPGSTDAAYSALSRGSGYITNRLLQCIRRSEWVESWFYVWELQKRGALHLHLFIEFKSEEKWLSLCEPLATAWYSALEAIGLESRCCMFEHGDGNKCTTSEYWRFDYQIARKSVGGYISKYVSKEADQGQVERNQGGVRLYYPRRWHGMSRNLCQQINQERKTVCVEGVRDVDAFAIIACLEEMATSCDPVLAYEYKAEIGRSKFRDGCFGSSYRQIKWFSPETVQDVELAMRTLFLRLTSDIRKTRVTFKGFALDYGGQPIPLETPTS